MNVNLSMLRYSIFIAFLLTACSSNAVDRRLENSLAETSLEGYGNYSSVSLQSSATFLLHRHLSQFGVSTTRISSVYVMEQVLTVNLILKDFDFEGFSIFAPSGSVVQLDLSEEQRSHILKRMEDVYHVTLRFRLDDEQIYLLETTASSLQNEDLLFSFVSGGEIKEEKAEDFYVWSRRYSFKEN